MIKRLMILIACILAVAFVPYFVGMIPFLNKLFITVPYWVVGLFSITIILAIGIILSAVIYGLYSYIKNGY